MSTPYQPDPNQPPKAAPPPPRAATPVAAPVARPVPQAAQPVAQPVPQHPVAQPINPAAPTAQPVHPQAARPIPVNQAQPIPVGPGATADVDDEPEAPDSAHLALKAAPPWMVSLAVHMVLLIILGLMMLPKMISNQITLDVQYAEQLGDQLENAVFESATSKELVVEEPEFSLDTEPAEDPLAEPPKLELMDNATSTTSDVAAPSIGMALNGREKGMKEALLAAYGGNATTEAAVKLGLQWLKRNQGRNGLWSLKGTYQGGGNTENKMAATAMALLAFQGAGHTHLVGEHKAVVAKAWKEMLRLQAGDGSFFREGGYHHRFYTHCQATIAICEVYAMTRDKKFRQPAQKALNYLFNNQDKEGGWRYYIKDGSDTSVTGWAVMALQSGRMGGLTIPSPALDDISKYLDRASTDGGSQYGYMPGHSAKISMTAEALLCRQYLGWKRNDPRLLKGCQIVAMNPINMNEKDVYYWYYATQVMHHMEGKLWNDWNKVMRQVLPTHQIKTGREKGSWSPSGDIWQLHGGRLYQTCLSIYMLEVYYRHMPLYKYRLK